MKITRHVGALLILLTSTSLLGCGVEATDPTPAEPAESVQQDIVEISSATTILYVGFGPSGPFWWTAPVGVADPAIIIRLGLPTAEAMTAAGTTETAVLAAVETAEGTFVAAGGALTGVGTVGTTTATTTATGTAGAAGGATVVGTVAIGAAIVAVAVVGTVAIDYSVNGNFFWDPVIAAYQAAPKPTSNDSVGVTAGWQCWNSTSFWSTSSYQTQCLACCDAYDFTTQPASASPVDACKAVCNANGS